MGNIICTMCVLTVEFNWVGEFDVAKGEIKSGTLKQCLDCTEPWENTANLI